MFAASRPDDFQPLNPAYAAANQHKTVLKALLMDDSQFDRKKIGRLAKQSKYSIEFIETSSISESRVALHSHRVDLVFLDYRVPDGDGIAFLHELHADGPYRALPVVIITGEGDETSAIRSLRSGAVDYLPKEALSVEEFDRAVRAAVVSTRPIEPSLESQLEEAREELATLRRKTRQNMNMARTYLMPMAQHAWASIQYAPEADREADASRLARITRNLAGFLDETLVHSGADDPSAEPELLHLHNPLRVVVSSSDRLAGSVDLAAHDCFPKVVARRDHLVMLVRELCEDILSKIPRSVQPSLRIDCAEDPSGNPIVRIFDNGPSLRERQDAFAEQSRGIAGGDTHPICQGMRLSLCQRLAEMNGGQLKVMDAAGGGCVTMIRFPAAPAVGV